MKRQWFVQSLVLAGLLLRGEHRVHAVDPTVDRQVRTLAAAGHVEGVFCVAFSPDGRHLASGGDEGEIVIWDAGSWRPVRTLDGDPDGKKGHFEDVWGVAFSPDGKQLASASHDETVRIWDVAAGRQSAILKGHSFHVWGVAFDRDGKRVASAGGTSDEAGRFSAGAVKVWDVSTARPVVTMERPGARVYSVAFHPDGKALASAWEDRAVVIWDAATGRKLFELAGHTGEVQVVAWSPDGKHLASGGADQTVRLWDVEARKEIRTFRGDHGLAYSADGKWLATGGDEGIGVWDAATGNQVRRIKAGTKFWSLAISPTGGQLAWPFETRTIKVWTAAD